jgi:hypothetical protein
VDNSSAILMFNYPSPNINCTLNLSCNSNTISVLAKVSSYFSSEISSTGKLTIISNYPQIKTDRIDVFETKKIAIVKTLTGITQYSLADLKNLKELSSLK